jgi:hypothetical protein
MIARKLSSVLGIVLLCSNLFSCKEDQSAGAADQMINHFAGSCRGSVGDWTVSALQQTQSLLAILKSIRDQQEKDCAGVIQAIEQTQNIQTQLQRLSVDPDARYYRETEEKKFDLLLAIQRASLAVPPDPALLASLRQELYSTEIELVSKKAAYTVGEHGRSKESIINGLSSLNNFASTLLSQGNLGQCIDSAPAMPLGIAASMLSVAGNFTTPVLGAGLSLVGSLMSTTVNYVRKLPLDKLEVDLNNTTMQAAVTCSLEAMSDLYCDAENARRFVGFALDSYGKNSQSNTTWKGMDLLGRRLPILNYWLTKVASGVEPSDSFSAGKQNEIWDKQNTIRKIKNNTVGDINNTKRLLIGVTDPNQIDEKEKAAFKKIIIDMYNTSGKSPIDEVYSPLTTVCILGGSGSNPNSPCSPTYTGNPPNFEFVIDKYGIDGGLAGLETRLTAMISSFERSINKELQDTINQDPSVLIAEATQRSLNNWSPLEVIKAVRDFTQEYATELRKTPGNDRPLALADETIQILDTIASDIVSSSTPKAVVTSIVINLRLLDGMQFLNQRVTQIVTWDLEDKIRRGELPKDISDDLIAAGISVADVLARSGINVQRDATKVLGDISNAQYISRENLKNSVDFFAKTIDKLAKKIKQSGIDAGETDPNDPAQQRLASLCILTLTTSNTWPKDIDIKTCRGTKLISAYKNSGVSLEFNDLERKILGGKKPLPYKDKVCLYSNFLRASRIFSAGNPELKSENPDSKLIPIEQNSLENYLGI